MKFYLKNNYLLAVPFILCIILFHFWGFVGQDGYDAIKYSQLATQWLQGSFDFSHHFAFRWVPVALTALSYPLFGMNDFATSFFPMLTNVITLLLVVRLLKQENRQVIIIALTISTFTNLNFFYSDKLLPDPYITTFFMGIIVFLKEIYVDKKTSVRYFIWVAVFLFLAFLTKGTVILLLPLFLLLFLIDIKQHKNIKHWMVLVATLMVLMITYIFALKHLTNNYFARFYAIGANSYLNRCSYESQPVVFLIKRLFYQWFVNEISAGAVLPLVFLVPLWLTRRFFKTIFIQADKFLAFVVLILLLSANFLSISISHYIPLCPDPRHFLFLTPIMAAAAATPIYNFFNGKKFSIILLILAATFLAISYFNYTELFYTLYFPAFFIIVCNYFFQKKWLLMVFLLIWIFQPIYYFNYAQKVGFDIQKKWMQKFKEKQHPYTIVSNHIQKHYWQYYNGFKTDSLCEFLSYEDIEIQGQKPSNDSIYLFLNFYTRTLGNQTDKDLPLFALDTGNYQLIKAVPSKGMFLFRLPKWKNSTPIFVSKNDYNNHDEFWNIVNKNILNGVENLNEYSATFTLSLAQLPLEKNFLRVHVKNKVKAIDDDEILLVLSVEQCVENVSNVWKGIRLKPYIRSFDEWWETDVYETIELTHNMQNCQLKIYLWNKNKGSYYLDNWQIEIY